MLRDLLWLYEAKLSYERGRETGLWGLFGIGNVIICILLWDDYLYPLLKWSGLVAFADQLGLIRDTAEITGWNVFVSFIGMLIIAVIFLIGAVAIGTISLVMLGIIYNNEKLTKIVNKLFVLAFSIIFSPLFLIIALFMFLKNPKRFLQNELATKKHKDEHKRYLQSRKEYYLKELGHYLTENEAKNSLNRLYLEGDTNFLLGLKDNKMYVLVPSPLYFGHFNYVKKLFVEYGLYHQNEFQAIEIDFSDQEKNDFVVVDEIYKNARTDSIAEFLYLQKVTLSDFNYITNCKTAELEYIYERITQNRNFKYTMFEINKQYLLERAFLKHLMAITTNHDDFKFYNEKLTNTLNASNVELLEIMYNDEIPYWVIVQDENRHQNLKASGLI